MKLPQILIALIGAITGIASLILHHINYKREKPILTFRMIDYFYQVDKLDENSNKLKFHFDLLLSNLGSKPTTITEINLKYLLGKDLIAIENKILDPPKRVEGNASVLPSIDFEVIEDIHNQVKRHLQKPAGILDSYMPPPIDVRLTIIHTYGVMEVPVFVYHLEDLRHKFIKGIWQSERERLSKRLG